MRPLKHICILLLLHICTYPVYAQLPRIGLYFYSHEQNIDKRTSLVLNDNESYRLNPDSDFKLEFDVFIRDQKIKFGYVFRIISNQEQNFDFIINNSNKGFLVIDNQDFGLHQELVPEQWNHISVSFHKKENKIRFCFNDEAIDCDHNLEQTKSLLINFGLCNQKGFIAHDVAPFILKDVRICDQNKEIHHWILGKQLEYECYDELKKRPASAQNPYWLMNNSIHWQKRIAFTTNTFPQVTFDSVGNLLYVQNRERLITYSLLNDTLTYCDTGNEVLMNQFYNRMIYNPLTDGLFYYGINNMNIAAYDNTSRRWNTYPEPNEEATHAHHNRYISPADSMLYLFGGYGYYKYHSNFFKVNIKTNEWTTTDFSHTIVPRYLAAMGGNNSGEKVYIFGGRGAEMGRQELSPKNFSDLYEVDLKTNKVKFLFDLYEKEGNDCIYSNSLVVDDSSNSLYLLAYPNNTYSTRVMLKRIDLVSQTMETLADSIDFHFKDTRSFCDLYYSPSLNKLIALLSYSEDEKTSEIQLYTLDFPPLNRNDVIQEKQKAGLSPLLIISLIIAGLAFFILIVVSRRINRKKGDEQDPDPSAWVEDPLPESEVSEVKDKKFYEIHKHSILFIGGFQVFNRDGDNITGEFTPTLKYMLVLIILYTLKNNKGISSSKLQELLWFDKPEEAARNNRSVNLRKLRVLLQEMGDLDISSRNGYWYISFSDHIFSDYKEALRLIDRLQNAFNEEDLLRLHEILSLGQMLPNIQFEWIDNFKTDFSNATIDVLTHIINQKNLFVNKPLLKLKIADDIIRIDPINEEAVAIKCNILYEMGKKGLAKTAFDSFTREYKSLLGEPYHGSIKKFLE